MPRHLAMLLVSVACGCGDNSRSSAALSAPADTLVINSRFSVSLPGHLVPFELLRPSYETIPDRVAHVTHAGAVACDTIGDALVVVSTRFSRRSALLKCRPIRSFSPFAGVRIPVGGAPVVVPVANWGLDGRPVTLLAGTAQVGDTTVAVLRDGLIHPKALGRTAVNIDFSGMQYRVGVEVIDTVASESVAFAGGEFRSWQLPHGRYEIMVNIADRSGAEPLALAILNANCADARIDRQAW